MALSRTAAEQWEQKGQAPESRTASPEELLALQLLARGYAAEQIGPLVGQTPSGARFLLDAARRSLGAADLRGAVREARARGLIV